MTTFLIVAGTFGVLVWNTWRHIFKVGGDNDGIEIIQNFLIVFAGLFLMMLNWGGFQLWD